MILELQGIWGIFLYNFLILHVNYLRLSNQIDLLIFQIISMVLESSFFLKLWILNYGSA